ncbi:hypothetical protein DIPPA_19297 [Diplonema papillatum]|nr:hypothetical protein DIPPA_19297 [Diplonema papillatum]
MAARCRVLLAPKSGPGWHVVRNKAADRPGALLKSEYELTEHDPAFLLAKHRKFGKAYHLTPVEMQERVAHFYRWARSEHMYRYWAWATWSLLLALAYQCYELHKVNQILSKSSEFRDALARKRGVDERASSESRQAAALAVKQFGEASTAPSVDGLKALRAKVQRQLQPEMITAHEAWDERMQSLRRRELEEREAYERAKGTRAASADASAIVIDTADGPRLAGELSPANFPQVSPSAARVKHAADLREKDRSSQESIDKIMAFAEGMSPSAKSVANATE